MSQLPLPGFAPGLLSRLTAILGNDTVRALLIWQVAGQIFTPILAPVIAEIQEQTFGVAPVLPLSPADAVDAYIKSHWPEGQARSEVRKSGLGDDAFNALAAIAGEPPGAATLLELWRRKVIPESGAGSDAISVEQGIREGRTKNKWIEPLKALKTALPSPEAALDALLEGQTDHATALDLYEQWGGDPRYFELMFETRGSAPTPLEAADMARRGIIPWEGEGPQVTSFRQAFLEGPWRNKWLEPYRAVSDYIPPPRATTAMLRNGSIDDATALKFYAAAGARGEVAQALLTDAHHRRTAADRELTKSDVLNLYLEQLVDRAQAEAMLGGLNYGPNLVAYLLDSTDFRRDKALLDKAVAKVSNLYIAHKLDKAGAQATLDALGLSPANRDHLLATWDQERQVNVRLLTPAELVSAAKAGYLSMDETYAELQGQGYTARDAALYMLIHGATPPGVPAGA